MSSSIRVMRELTPPPSFVLLVTVVNVRRYTKAAKRKV